jgi:hypothetical protein
LASTLQEFNYRNTVADPNVWIKPAIHADSNLEYCEMVLVYVDDILHVSHNPKDFMDQISKIYQLKAGSVGPPSSRYLGANIDLYSLAIMENRYGQ